MRVTIRTDASTRIGSGHLVRCLTLAGVLRESGATVRFVTRRHDLPAADRILRTGFDVAELPAAPDGSAASDAGYRTWLGVPQERDAAETLRAIGDDEADHLLIVDHYGLDAEWETCLADRAGRILVIDDLANRPHAADILVDQNLRRDGADAYRELVPTTCRVLASPNYALIRDEYLRARRPVVDEGSPPSVLVSLGGVDDLELLATIMDGLASLGSMIGAIDLTVTDPEVVRQQRGQRVSHPDVRLHRPLPHLAELMSQSGLAIGAGGGTTWERFCVGLPSLVVSRAENQRRGIEELASLGAIIDLGEAAGLSPDQLAAQTADLLRSPAAQQHMHELGQALVDGRGCRRVLETLIPTPHDRLSIREASSQDRGVLWMWANDPTVRERSLNPHPISWPEHVHWFARTSIAPEVRLLILEADGLPVGQLRFDLRDGRAIINYSLDTCVRGRGWGREIVERGLRWLRSETGDTLLELVAIVRVDNQASMRVFERLGFERATSSFDGELVHRFTRDLVV